MKTPRRLPPELEDRPFTFEEARRRGVSLRRLRHGSLEPLGKGLRTAVSLDRIPLLERVRPFLDVNDRCAVSHLTAAELGGLPSRRRISETMTFHVIRPEGSADLKRPRVVVHRAKLYDDEITTYQGVRITTPERTWLDLAEMLTVDELVVAGDHLVRIPYPEFEDRTAPLCTVADLQRMIDRHKGKRGLRKAKLALQLIREGSDSPQETLLRLAIGRAGLPEPELNVPVEEGRPGRRVQPDLSYRQYRIAIEYEGDGHGEESQIVRDIARSERYRELDWVEVRISKRHMQNDAGSAVAKIRTALIQAGWRPGRGA
ncbi:hypothetical protein [Arthrobacter sp. NPDC090010]|uniref:hypothetical protein n=1 Tax=Arthrobacter sp. NPDC090010 TaxID=3363942 RepID=UPI003808291D